MGNPNSGKTSLFNAISGGHEHVGNYSGVTVDAKRGHCTYRGYRFEITDLPGTYALTAYSPEELYVRRHLAEHTPDVIINAVVASNLERNLYLTTELIDLNPRVVVALNMYDELEASGAELDSPTLSQRLVASGDFTPASALAFLVFILLYLPCIATIVAIAAEIGWRWACISVLYNTALAWIMAYLTYHLFSWL